MRILMKYGVSESDAFELTRQASNIDQNIEASLKRHRDQIQLYAKELSQYQKQLELMEQAENNLMRKKMLKEEYLLSNQKFQHESGFPKIPNRQTRSHQSLIIKLEQKLEEDSDEIAVENFQAFAADCQS